MEPLSQERWRSVCSALRLVEVDDEYAAVIRGWKSWGRHYHTLTHLTACLRELDTAQKLAERPAEVELALWFHDAVYRTYRFDNEARSAEWAARFVVEHGGAPEAALR